MIGEPAGEVLDGHRRRRAAAEAAADRAESRATEAARRAAAAIAAAAAAAQEAEAAAAAAERAAERAEVERAAEVAYTSLPVGSPSVVGPGPAPVPAPAGRDARPRHGRREPVGPPAGVLAPGGADAVTELIPVADEDAGLRNGRRSAEARLRAAAISRAAAQDPDTAVIGRSAEDDVTAVAGEVTAVAPRRRHGRPDEASPPARSLRDRDEAEDHDQVDGEGAGRDPIGGPDGEAGRPGAIARFRDALRSRSGRTVAIAGAAVLVVAAGAGAVGAALHRPTAAAAPSPVAAAAPETSAAPAAADATETVDPQSPKAVAFRKALRKAGVPVSTSGLAETQAAALICDRIGSGTSDKALARSLPAVLPTVTDDDASAVVGAARTTYC